MAAQPPLEVGAGQIVQQHVELRVEQRLPPLDKMLAQIVLVGQHAVETASSPVLLGDGEAQAEQSVHRAVEKPAAMDGELAARIAQAVDGQELER